MARDISMVPLDAMFNDHVERFCGFEFGDDEFDEMRCDRDDYREERGLSDDDIFEDRRPATKQRRKRRTAK